MNGDTTERRVRNRRRQRRIVDIALIVLVLVGVGAIVAGHWKGQKEDLSLNDRAVISYSTASGSTTSETSQLAPTTTNEHMSTTSSFTDGGDEMASPTSDVNASSLLGAEDASSTEDLFASHTPLRFSDVTTKSYESKEIGFVMALPENWSLIDEHPDMAEFSDQTLPYGARLDDAIAKPDAMWISVTKPCDATEATSTRFSPGEGTDTPTLEETICIPPFLVVLGLRSDTPYALEREFFLYSIARTLYPIVK